MSKTRQLTRAAQRAAARLAAAPPPLRFRVVGLVCQVEVEVLNPETGKAKARNLLARGRQGESQIINVHMVEEQLDSLNRDALMAILADAGVHPTD